MTKKTKTKWEFGDFQTPYELAFTALQTIKNLKLQPKAILEPTCGEGSFVIASNQLMPNRPIIAVDINGQHLGSLQQTANPALKNLLRIIQADFFKLDWENIIAGLPDPILILGNPPWVTSAELGILGSKNLPQKSNFQGRNGFDAITGKSNFDISEWMLLKYLDWLKSKQGIIAVLCKTAVARKVLLSAWKNNYPISSAQIYKVDALKYFEASVDACFLVIEVNRIKNPSNTCAIYENLDSTVSSHEIGFSNNIILADLNAFRKWLHLFGTNRDYIWRSGIKHDCSRVMELTVQSGNIYLNGDEEEVFLEDLYLYPMLKSSDIGNGFSGKVRKYMLVTQKYVGEDTSPIRMHAPKTWEYLNRKANLLARRSSSIYRKRAPFSIFGVGDYSFAPFKVAISGFYKNLTFKIITPHDAKPIVLDDTINFLSCASKKEAVFLASLLNSHVSKEFYNSMIFWSDKRPITVEILKRLNLHALAAELGKEKQYLSFFRNHQIAPSLFDKVLIPKSPMI